MHESAGPGSDLPYGLINAFLGGDETGNGMSATLSGLGDNATDISTNMPQPSATGPYLTSFGPGEFGDMTIQPLNAQNVDPNLDIPEMPGPSNVQQQSVMGQYSSDSEADGDWDPYYSDSQSDGEHEARALTMQPVDPASIPTMDMAEFVRLPRTAHRPALSMHEMAREARRLEPLITPKELDEFFAGEANQEYIRREPLALLRALELHGVAKLSDLTWVPKLRVKRQVDMQQLATDIGLPVNYFKQAYIRVAKRHSTSKRAPAWIYTVIEKLSLNEGRKPLPPAPPASPPNASGPSFDDMIKEAQRLEPLISRSELDEFFGGEWAPYFIQRKQLALIRALALHNISKLGDLSGAPNLPGGRRINRIKLAAELKLSSNYYKIMHDKMAKYHGKNKPIPNWMSVIMAKFSLRPSPDVPEPSYISAMNGGVPLTYSIAIEQSKRLCSSILDGDISTFFGDVSNKDNRRKILALIQVLRNNNVQKLGQTTGTGRVNAGALSNSLGIPENYFYSARNAVKRFHRIDKRAPDWMYKMLEPLSLDEDLGPGPGVAE
jgi:ribosomal protein L39E